MKFTQVASAWLPLPPTSNNSYVNIAHGRAKSMALKDWEEAAGWTWRAEGTMPKEPLGEKQTWGWSGKFYFPTSSKRDLDNHTKHVTDLIVRVVFGGAPDDRYMTWCNHRKLVDKKNPGVMVTVWEMDSALD
jgi:Holliday junction resolvase RusA-like endonuclease